MTDRKQIENLINISYAARRTGDVETIVEMFHPDAVFAIMGSKTTAAFAGTSQGIANLRAMLSGLITLFEFIERKFISVIIDGERAVVHTRVTMRFVPNAREITTDMVDLWKFRDGKVVEFLEFVDTALINDLTR